MRSQALFTVLVLVPLVTVGIVLASIPRVEAHHAFLAVPGEFPSLQHAIDASHGGDLIVLEAGTHRVAAGTYPGDGRTAGPIIEGLHSVTIVGAGPGETVIDVEDHHHGFLFAGSSTGCTLAELTIRGRGANLVSALDNTNALTLRNVVVEVVGSGGGVVSEVGSITITSCTFVGSGTGVALTSSSTGNVATNSIFDGFASFANDPALFATSYCAFHQVAGTLPAGPGVQTQDPLFADRATGDFHLQSTRGRWNGLDFVADPVSSPCIDAGNPVAPLAAEVWPHGGRLNLGAYGGTADASLSPGGCVADVCGDCDGTGAVDVLDSLWAARVGAGLAGAPPVGSNAFDSCNVAGVAAPGAGAVIDVLDALEIARDAVGLSVVVCCR